MRRAMSSMCGFRPRFSWTTRMPGSFPVGARRTDQIAPQLSLTLRRGELDGAGLEALVVLRDLLGRGEPRRSARRGASWRSSPRPRTWPPVPGSRGDRCRRARTCRRGSAVPDRNRLRSSCPRGASRAGRQHTERGHSPAGGNRLPVSAASPEEGDDRRQRASPCALGLLWTAFRAGESRTAWVAVQPRWVPVPQAVPGGSYEESSGGRPRSFGGSRR